MDVPGRGTSSAFLLLTFNIGIILSQSVGQECPFPATHQGEVHNEYNPGIANLQLPKNKIRFYPAKIHSVGTTGAIAECQKPPIEENFSPALNQPALSTEPCPSCYGPANKQSRLDQLCSSESCNGQKPVHPNPEPLLHPSPCPEPPITPYSPQNKAQFEVSPQRPFQLQPFSHGISNGQLPLSFANPDRPVQTPVNDVESPQQSPSVSSNNAFTSLSVPMLRKYFTPLVPYPNSRVPLTCADIQPTLYAQDTSVPVEPLNGCLASQVDVLPMAQSREQENPSINYPASNLEPEQTLPSPPTNCLPQSSAIEPCDTFSESQPYSSIPPSLLSIDPFQDPSALFPCDQCKFTRSLCSCPVSSCQSCLPACHSSICDDEPSLFQIETCLQVPNNIPSCVCNENCRHRPYSDFRQSLSLNSGCCSCSNNDFFMPQTCCTPQSSCTTSGTSKHSFDPSPPQVSCNCSPTCPTCAVPSSTPVSLPSCESPCCSPEPITLQINVPPPIIPAPSIIIINAAPEPEPTSIDSGSFDMPPMIIDSRRRRSKSWLPLLLVWLFSCDGCGGFGGYGGGCDSCPIPFPFPIPILT